MRWLLIVLAAQAHLIELTGPDQQTIAVSPSQVVTVREPRGDQHFGAGVKCLLHTTDGKFVAVAEDCRTVRQLLELQDQD